MLAISESGYEGVASRSSAGERCGGLGRIWKKVESEYRTHRGVVKVASIGVGTMQT